MLPKIRFSIIGAVVVLAVGAACNGGARLPEGVLLQDDFSNPRSGWMVLEDNDGFLRYVDDAYVVRINTPRVVLWGLSNAGQDFSNMRVDVSARDKSEVFEVSFGVICNYGDAANFYLFEIGPDGFYRVVSLDDGEQRVLAGEELSPDIAIGHEVYRLQVQCAHSEQVLRVDGKEIARTRDTAHTQGDVGLVAHSYDRGGVQIHFDDISVTSIAQE